MDCQTVLKREPFVLQGRDGGTYYSMYPRDSILSTGESINCHCMMKEVADEKEQSDLGNKVMEEVNARYDEEHGTRQHQSLRESFKERTACLF